jgi:hypothetical protein
MAFLAPAAAVAGGATAAAGTAAALTTAQMVAIGLTAAAGLVGAYSQYQAGKAEARIASENAKYKMRQAQDATDRGISEQDRIRLQLRRVLGAQRARFGSGNVDLMTGNPLEVAADSSREAELDMLTARNNAAREAFGFQQEARLERMRGRQARKHGRYGALGTLLTSGSQAYGIYKGP